MNGKIVESWDGYRWLIKRKRDSDATRPYELTPISILKEIGGLNRLFVDVGANVGMYSVRMSGNYGKVIAVEPDPFNFEVLKENLRLNGADNVIPIQVACGENEGEGKLKCQQTDSKIVSDEERDNVIPVKIEKLDDVVFKNVSINDYDLVVVKVDVEGYEERVIRGAEKLIKSIGAVFVVEHHEHRGYAIKGSQERIIEFFKPTHYCLNLNEVHWMYIPKKRDISFWEKDGLSIFEEVVANHYLFKCIENIAEGKPWYFGLPHTWWYGMSLLDFYKTLPEHVLKEKEWVEGL